MANRIIVDNSEGVIEVIGENNAFYRDINLLNERQPDAVFRYGSNQGSWRANLSSIAEILKSPYFNALSIEAFCVIKKKSGKTRYISIATRKITNHVAENVSIKNDPSFEKDDEYARIFVSQINHTTSWDQNYLIMAEVSLSPLLSTMRSNSGEETVIGLNVNTSNAKTTYIRNSIDDKEVSHDGAIVQTKDKQELIGLNSGGGFSLNWNDGNVSSWIDPSNTGTYGVECTIGGKLRFYADEGAHASSKSSGDMSFYDFASYVIISRPFKPISLRIVNNANEEYFNDGSQDFAKPTSEHYVVTYDNEEEVEAYPNSTSTSSPKVEYYLDEGCTQTADGRKMDPSKYKSLYVKIRLNDFVNNVYQGRLKSIVYKQTMADSVSASGSFILGSTPISQINSINVSATLNSGTSSDNIPYNAGKGNLRYEFEYPNSAYDDSTKPLNIYIFSYGSKNGPYDISKMETVEMKKPEISEATAIAGKRLSQALINGTAIDLTDTVVKVTYKDSDATNTLKFDKGNKDENGTFRALCTELPNNPFDGSEGATVNVTFDDGKLEKELTLVLNGKDKFGTEITPKELKIVVYEVAEIKGIALISPTTEYKVGDSFLNEEDKTIVKIWYSKQLKDNTIKEGSFKIPLRNSFSSLSVYPPRGTEFFSTGTVTVRVQSIFDTTKYVTYDVIVNPAVKMSSDSTTETYRFVKNQGSFTYKTENGDCEIKNDMYVKVKDTDVDHSSEGALTIKGEFAKSYDSEKGVKIYGYLANVNKPDLNGVLVDFNDCVPPISGSSNMTIKFPCYDKNASSFVEGCTFGTRFGHNNSLNRLFLSGNPNMPNYDIHSVEPNIANENEGSSVLEGDFSYFPDEAMCKYGESENSIVGYDVVSDSKLLVLKNKSAKERTIYFRVPNMVTMLDSSGNVMKDVSGNELKQEEYSVYMSNSPVAGVSQFSIANFNGDTVFVDDDNEVAGLDIEGIVGDSQRQANTRSHYIDRKLKGFDMSKANLETFGRYLILDIPNVAAFVTDRETISNGQYEWWRIDSMGSRCFMEMDGELYYATEDGTLCKLVEGEYSDKDRYFINVALGDMSSDKVIITDSNYTDIFNKENLFTWRTKPKTDSYKTEDAYMAWIYSKVIDATFGDSTEAKIDKEKNLIKVKGDYVKRLGSLNKVYLNPIQGTFENEMYGKPFSLSEVKDENDLLSIGTGKSNTFKLLDKDGKRVNLSEAKFANGFSVCRRLDGEIPARKSADGEIQLYDGNGDDAKPLDLIRYGGQDRKMQISGVLTKILNIKSRLVSAPLMISTANWFKHIIKMDISEGTNDVSDIAVAYCNNKIPYIVEDSVMDRGQTIDLGMFSFLDVDFSTTFYTRTYTIGRELKCIKYISVAFASDKDMNSVVPSVSLTYTVSRLSRGVGD